MLGCLRCALISEPRYRTEPVPQNTATPSWRVAQASPLLCRRVLIGFDRVFRGFDIGLWLMYGVKQYLLPVFRLLSVAPGSGADCSRQRQEDFAVGHYSRVIGIMVEVLGLG